MPFSGFPLAIGEWIYATGYNQIQAAVAERYTAFGDSATSSQSATGDWITYALLSALWDDILGLKSLAGDESCVSWCDEDGEIYPGYDFEDFVNAVTGGDAGSRFWTYAPVDADWIYAATWNAMRDCIAAFRYLKMTPEHNEPSAGDNYHDRRYGSSYPASSDVDAEWAAAVSAWSGGSYSEQDGPGPWAGVYNGIARSAGPVYFANVFTYRTSEIALVLPATFPATYIRKVKLWKGGINYASATKGLYGALYDENDYGGDVVASFTLSIDSGNSEDTDDVQDLYPEPYLASGGGTLRFSLLSYHPDDSPGDEIDPDDYRPATPTSNTTWQVNMSFQFPIDHVYYTPKVAYGFVAEPAWSYV